MEGSSLVTGPGRVRPLGDLEAAIMELLWDSGASRLVRDVVADLGPQRPLAYTTVMTVMDNLHRKGWLIRESDGRARRYAPAASRQASPRRAPHAATATDPHM